MTYRAAVAYPCIDSDRAIPDLHDRLRELAARAGAPGIEWSTLRVAGPAEVVDPRGRVRYEWVATVEPVAPTSRSGPHAA